MVIGLAGRRRGSSCVLLLLQVVGPLMLLQLVSGVAGVSPPGVRKEVPPAPSKFPRLAEGLGRPGAGASEQGTQPVPPLPEELRQSLRGKPSTSASKEEQPPAPAAVAQQHAAAAAAAGTKKEAAEELVLRAAAPPQQLDAGLELWKQQVETNVRQELAKETRFINQLMKKQSLAEAKQHRLEKALRMLISHYRTSQARAHQSEVTLHRLSTWAHEAHSEMVSMEKGLAGHAQAQGERVQTLWSSAAGAFEAMGGAKDAAEQALDAQEAAEAQATADAESALADDPSDAAEAF